MKQRGYNFNPGPAVLPDQVLRQTQEDLWDYRGSGIGVAELSHRGKHFEEIIQETDSLLRQLAHIPDSYEILFCTGGATQQFSMVPMNLVGKEQTANYILSGVWGELACEEAKKFGKTHIAGSSKEKNYHSLPDRFELAGIPAYLHFTSNNTVVGSQFQSEPGTPETISGQVPLICDASSDILSRPIDVSKYSLIYAGSQKNLGPAGVTIVILKKELLECSPDNLPVLMDYRTYAKSKSLYNTPPTLPIAMLREVLLWLKNLGGVDAIAKRNAAKAEIVYQRIDASEFYSGIIDVPSRSKMNITFSLQKMDLEKKFLAEAEQHNLFGLKGHRLLGGFRASMYNAFPLEGATALVDFMNEFERVNG